MKSFWLDDEWNRRFLSLAREISTWSKDPSTQTGSVIVGQDKRIISLGYNGFPQGIKDTPELLENREEKYKRTVHCEMNAILFANQSLEDTILYTYPFLSCERCAVHVVQSGIKICIAPDVPEDLAGRWSKSVENTKKIFEEANVYWKEVDYSL